MTETSVATDPPRSPFLWGLFCACSWTWCIGMYLPVLLIDRFGWNGFVAFAVPNVLGCSAMAFVLLRKRGQTPFPVARHRGMMVAFSLVTVAYQVFFAAWLVGELIPQMSLPWWTASVVAGVIFLLGLLFSLLPDRDWLALSLVTYGISLAAVFVIGGAGFDRVPMHGSLPDERLWLLLPTLCYGFLLCPYLDLTFHRAAQSSSQPRVSFVIFGIAFAIMLGLTVLLWYNDRGWYRRYASLLMLGHILGQLIFTCGAHLREVRVSPALGGGLRRWAALAMPALAIAALPVTRFVLRDDVRSGEWTYLSFLACYGLIFPAYVMTAMASDRPFATRVGWAAFAGMVVLCMPLYAMGFLFDKTVWLVPPVALFVAWGLLRRR